MPKTMVDPLDHGLYMKNVDVYVVARLGEAQRFMYVVAWPQSCNFAGAHVGQCLHLSREALRHLSRVRHTFRCEFYGRSAWTSLFQPQGVQLSEELLALHSDGERVGSVQFETGAWVGILIGTQSQKSINVFKFCFDFFGGRPMSRCR